MPTMMRCQKHFGRDPVGRWAAWPVRSSVGDRPVRAWAARGNKAELQMQQGGRLTTETPPEKTPCRWVERSEQ